MKITVDPWTCQGHVRCLAEAPELFDYDEDDGYAHATDGDVPAELEDVARRAAAQCPERAITVE